MCLPFPLPVCVQIVRFLSGSLLLASGGAGHVYPNTTNPTVHPPPATSLFPQLRLSNHVGGSDGQLCCGSACEVKKEACDGKRAGYE